MCWCTSKGQATVEAALGIPVLFVLLLMLLQPGIVLYDRMVMRHAAAEGCRLLATRPAGLSDERCKDLVVRSLGAIPPHSLFHVHSPTCSWEVALVGDEASGQTTVAIRNRLRLLPIFDAAGAFAGIADEQGCIEIEVAETAPAQPGWAAQSQTGINPEAWVNGREG